MLVYSFSKELQTPENQSFLAKWRNVSVPRTTCTNLRWRPTRGCICGQTARKAGSVDRMKVIEALESGVSFQTNRDHFPRFQNPSCHYARAPG